MRRKTANFSQYNHDRNLWFWVALVGALFTMHAALIMLGAWFLILPIIAFLVGFRLARKSYPVGMSLFLAGCFMVFIHVIVPLPSQIIAHYRMQQYVLGSVGEYHDALNPIEVTGNVAVQWHDSTKPFPSKFKRGISCYNFCKRLLYQRAVTTVTMANIEHLSISDLREGKAGRIISAKTYRRRAASECHSIAHPNHVDFSNRKQWELLRNRCFEETQKVSEYDYLIRHGFWTITQPSNAREPQFDLRKAGENNNFVGEFQEVRGPTGRLDYRRFCTELHPISPVLFIHRTNYADEGFGYEPERQKLTTESFCGTFENSF